MKKTKPRQASVRPLPDPAPKSVPGAPSSGDLRTLVVVHALQPLRDDSKRQTLRKNAAREDDPIEAALLGEDVRREIAAGIAAYVEEHTSRLVAFVFKQAFAGQGWACKTIFDVSGVTEKIKAALGSAAEPSDTFISSAFERRFIEKLRRLGNDPQEPWPANEATLERE